MKRILKLMSLLVLSAAVGACAPSSVVIKDIPLQPGEFARVDTAVAADGIEGEYAQLARFQIRQPNGAVADSTAMFNGRSTAGQIANTAVGTLGPAAVNGVFGLAIAGQSSCKSANCGTQISVGGATSVAESGSVAQNQNEGTLQTGGFCLDVAPDGSCRQQ